MAAYRRVYDSHHLQAGCQDPGLGPEPYTLGNRAGLPFLLKHCVLLYSQTQKHIHYQNRLMYVEAKASDMSVVLWDTV